MRPEEELGQFVQRRMHIASNIVQEHVFDDPRWQIKYKQFAYWGYFLGNRFRRPEFCALYRNREWWD
eukprot:8355874-Karenia_brevis.AAC.1